MLSHSGPPPLSGFVIPTGIRLAAASKALRSRTFRNRRIRHLSDRNHVDSLRFPCCVPRCPPDAAALGRNGVWAACSGLWLSVPRRIGTKRTQGRALTFACPGDRLGPFTETGLHEETRRMAGPSPDAGMPAVPAWRSPHARNEAFPVIGRHGRRPAPPLGGRVRRRRPGPRSAARDRA